MSSHTPTGLAVGLLAGTVGVAVAAVRRHAVIAGAVPPELRHPASFVLMPVSRGTLRLWRTMTSVPTKVVGGVRAARELAQSGDGSAPVPVWVYEPLGQRRAAGAVLWIHGGGFVMGTPEASHRRCSALAAELGVVVVNVDYRCAPEHSFPAALEDCYAALVHLHRNAERWGVDPGRIAVAGESAGAGLAACVAQAAQDRGEVALSGQVLIYPMLDDRTVLRADHVGTGRLVWSPSANRFGWTAYLGAAPTDASPPAYAAASRCGDLTGLPPTWIGVGDVDLFHAEDVEYAARLTAAGVPCELVVVPGMYHGADVLRAKVPAIVAFKDSWVTALRVAVGAR